MYRPCKVPDSRDVPMEVLPSNEKPVVLLPARPEQGHKILQAKLEVLDLVATERGSGESPLAILQCRDTPLDCILHR